MILATGEEVGVVEKEIKEFITVMAAPLANPYWKFSELLSEDEVRRYCEGRSPLAELRKVGRYLVVFYENLAFTVYLEDKLKDPESVLDILNVNLPALIKVRELNKRLEKEQGAGQARALVVLIYNVCSAMGAEGL